MSTRYRLSQTGILPWLLDGLALVAAAAVVAGFVLAPAIA